MSVLVGRFLFPGRAVSGKVTQEGMAEMAASMSEAVRTADCDSR